MTAILISAFVLGGLGSLHCVGMCGPIALSLPVVKKQKGSKPVSVLLYNAGRVSTYTLFGCLFGAIGQTFAFFGYQRWLSISLGTMILILLALSKKNHGFENKKLAPRLFFRLRSRLGGLFKKRNYRSVFFIGLLNGLLPCGLVYMAIAGAIATASVLKSSLFMAFFGLGTLPMMLGVGFFGNLIGMTGRRKIRSAYPYLMIVLASLLIVRGLGLGIPYLSPGASSGHSAVLCH